MVLPDILKNAPFFKKIETKSVKQAQAKSASRAKQAAAASWREYQDWKRTSVEVNRENGAIVSITWDEKEKERGMR